MRTYPALGAVALLVKIVAIGGATLGVVGGAIMARDMLSAGAGTIISAAIGGLLLWAAAELLLVFANMGEDIGRLVQSVDRIAAQQTRSASPSEGVAGAAGKPNVTQSELLWTRAGTMIFAGPEAEHFGELVGEDSDWFYVRRNGSSETVAFRRTHQRDAA